METGMRRREVLGGLVGAVAWPIGAHAHSGIPIIGFLGAASPATTVLELNGFREGLSEVVIELTDYVQANHGTARCGH